jgi:hypothetical protein
MSDIRRDIRPNTLSGGFRSELQQCLYLSSCNGSITVAVAAAMNAVQSKTIFDFFNIKGSSSPDVLNTVLLNYETFTAAVFAASRTVDASKVTVGISIFHKTLREAPHVPHIRHAVLYR